MVIFVNPRRPSFAFLAIINFKAMFLWFKFKFRLNERLLRFMQRFHEDFMKFFFIDVVGWEFL